MPERTQHIRFEEIENKDGFYITAEVVTASTAGNYGVIFTAIHPVEILAVTESHTTAGSDAGTVTLDLERLEPGEALNSGDAILETPFNLKSTANTPVTRTAFATSPRMFPGERLALKDSGTLTAVAGVQVTIYLKRLGKGDYR